ncbi:MAG TPA: 2-C-methyl-D-erythritol 4-phosphate cytidylyltransferase [Acidimicrobiales bacterium]
MNTTSADRPDPAAAASEVVWAIVVAGGSGDRFGRPKQFLELGGRTVAERSVAAARGVASGVVLVVPAGQPVGAGAPDPTFGADVLANGGASRAASVRAGLAAVPAEAAVVVVHDAARPLAPSVLFESVVAAVTGPSGADGAVPVLPVTDTLKRVADNQVVATVDRDGLVSVQTPQAFRASVLRQAHRDETEGTDDASLLESIGATVRTVPGDPRNLKLTVPHDLVLAEILVRS